MSGETTLERFSPLLLYNLLTSVRRFEPDFYSYLCRTFHLDADRILGLFSDVDALGPGQLKPILASLREHLSYHDIVYLAGRNALTMWADEHSIPLSRRGGAPRFVHLLKDALLPFLGRASVTLMIRGEIHFVELRDSPFARGVAHHSSVCGFYSGVLAELGRGCTQNAATAVEVRCRAAEPEASSCLIQVTL